MKKTINLNEPDQNIVNALKEIKVPIEGINQILFDFVKESGRTECFFHIAVKRHRLRVRDIKELPSVLRKPLKIKRLRNNNYYFGKRPGRKCTDVFLKVVTRNTNDKNKELIITYFPINKIN